MADDISGYIPAYHGDLLLPGIDEDVVIQGSGKIPVIQIVILL